MIASHIDWPIVVKPLHSAASDGVVICRSTAELQQAFDSQCGVENSLGIRNNELLAQELLRGPEFVVDTVSCNGMHRVSDIWESHKTSTPQSDGRRFLYDYQSLLSPSAPQANVLQSYVFQVLDALGIEHGPAHAEVIITAEGPVLVEIGARLAGTQIPVFVNECTDKNPVQLTVDSYCDEKKFISESEHPYVIKKHARLLYLHANQSGRLKSFPSLHKIRSLSSYHQLNMQTSIGERLSKTIDLSTVAGVLELANNDISVLCGDHAQFSSMRDTGFFEIAPDDEGTDEGSRAEIGIRGG